VRSSCYDQRLRYAGHFRNVALIRVRVRWNQEYLCAQLMVRLGMRLVRSTAVNCCDSRLLHIAVGIGADGRVDVCQIRLQGTHYAHALACMRMLSVGNVC
jgi:hypothetical protein